MFSSNTSQVSNDANYIEDVFSTYLYAGNGLIQTINNGIELGAGYLNEVSLVGNGVAPTGTATADSYIDVRTPIKALDNQVADGNYIWHSGSSGTHWWKYDFGAGNAKVVTRYRMMMRQSNDSYRATGWTFQGSNDDSTWTTLDTKSGQVFPTPTDGVPTDQQNNKFNTYFVSSPGSYRYYRFYDIYSSSGSYVLIGELELVGGTSSSLVPTSGKGGLVWIKARSNADWNIFEDTARGVNQALSSNNTNAQATFANSVTSFNSNGFSLGSSGAVNDAAYSALVSWTFRKQPKFFDVVTFTSNASGGATFSHALAANPGCIIAKSTSATGSWFVYHATLDPAEYLLLNSTAAAANGGRAVTTTTTQVTYPNGYLAASTQYVAYLFANEEGGFGLTGTDNVITCGLFTTDGSGNATVNLGYEPQWILTKSYSTVDNWQIGDSMRGMTVSNTGVAGTGAILRPNTSGAETSTTRFMPTATGFQFSDLTSQTYIYIAIRRGPMKTPTTGTSVFSPNASNAPANGTQITTNFPVDLSIWKDRDGTYSGQFQDRLRGLPESAGTGTATLYPDSTAAESSNQTGYQYWNTGFKTYAANNNIWWALRRAPGFFDEVCYTGTGSATTFNHNLGVVPELMIFKRRSSAAAWGVYCNRYNGGVNANQYYQLLNQTDAESSGSGLLNNTSPTSSVFTVGTWNENNASGSTYVAYLFASCPGVSKVGSYSGTGATQTISCGFAARFVLIKRTDSTGDWFVWDTARGMVAGTDPRLALNSTAAESNANWVYTNASGFQIVTTDATVNASGGSYIYLCIA